MALLIGILSVILIALFWRILLPLALVIGVGGLLLVLGILAHADRAEDDRRASAERLRARIAAAQRTPTPVPARWQVLYAGDPASGDSVPRYAGVSSDDRLCNLMVEKRLTGARLTSIDCGDIELVTYRDDIQVKFDDRPTSDPMRLRSFTAGQGAYIPEYQGTSRLSYREFVNRLSAARRVALLLTTRDAGSHWITFSLQGSSSALTAIGALQ